MPTNPDINGIVFDWSSVEIHANGTAYKGVKSLNYSHKLEPGKRRGTTAQVTGRSRGQYDAEGALEMYKADADELLRALGNGYMEKSFDIVANYADTGQPTSTSVLVGCRIKSDADEGSEGSDPLVTKFDLDIIAIRKNGIDPITNLRA